MHNSLLTEKFWIPHEDCLLTHACSPHHLVPPSPQRLSTPQIWR